MNPEEQLLGSGHRPFLNAQLKTALANHPELWLQLRTFNSPLLRAICISNRLRLWLGILGWCWAHQSWVHYMVMVKWHCWQRHLHHFSCCYGLHTISKRPWISLDWIWVRRTQVGFHYNSSNLSVQEILHDFIYGCLFLNVWCPADCAFPYRNRSFPSSFPFSFLLEPTSHVLYSVLLSLILCVHRQRSTCV